MDFSEILKNIYNNKKLDVSNENSFIPLVYLKLFACHRNIVKYLNNLNYTHMYSRKNETYDFLRVLSKKAKIKYVKNYFGKNNIDDIIKKISDHFDIGLDEAKSYLPILEGTDELKRILEPDIRKEKRKKSKKGE